jgi:predicted transcriptional regulator
VEGDKCNITKLLKLFKTQLLYNKQANSDMLQMVQTREVHQKFNMILASDTSIMMNDKLLMVQPR